MEITDLRVEDYSKVVELSQLYKPQLLSDICIFDKKDFAKDIQCFDVADRNGHRFQLYVSKVPPQNIIDKVIFLSKTPKFLFLRGDSQHIVLEKKIHDRLDNYIIFYDSKQSPYLQQAEAKKIMMDVTESLEDFEKNSIRYQCLSPKNIVRIDEKWYLSSIGTVFDVDKNLDQYYTDKFKGEQRIVYALGALLFKLVFGFVPFESSKKWTKPFEFIKYLEYLESLEIMKSLKIYYFAERMRMVSDECKDLIENSLTGKLNLQKWKEHKFFSKKIDEEEVMHDKSKQIQMINSFGITNCSLILSAIEHKSKYPLEKLNPKNINNSEELSYVQILDQYKKNHLLKHLTFAPDFEQRQVMNIEEDSEQIFPSLAIQYFFQDNFDPQQDFPCRQLIKYIEQQKQQCPELYKKSNQREYDLKLYAYPYSVAFELLKVQKFQPLQLKKKLKKTIELLLQLSALNYPGKTKHLHLTEPKVKRFDEMKSTFRQNVNELYKHFLNEAMRKYNSKKEASLIERAKQKQKGLEYYRLCLKLLQASLIVRKGGKDLDLGRIETSQRKQIQNDLSTLLKQYFPNKAQIH